MACVIENVGGDIEDSVLTSFQLDFGFTATEGNILLTFVVRNEGDLGQLVVPSGATLIADDLLMGTAGGVCALAWEVASASQTYTTWTNPPNSRKWSGGVVEISGALAAAPIDAYATDDNGQASASAQTGPAVVVTSAGAAVISMCGVDGLQSGFTIDASLDEGTWIEPTAGGGAVGSSGGAMIQAAYGSSGAFDFTTDSSAYHITASVAIVPDVSGFEDAFDSANGTALATHDSLWADIFTTHPVADCEIQSGMATTTVAHNDFGARYTGSTADFSEVVFKAGSYTQSTKAVAIRTSAISEGYYATFEGLTGDVFANISIYSHGGVWVQSANGSWNRTLDHTVRLTASGTGSVTLNLWVDTVQVITDEVDTGSTIDSGNPGFWATYIDETESNYRFDDWTDNADAPGGVVVPVITNTIMNMMRDK